MNLLVLEPVEISGAEKSPGPDRVARNKSEARGELILELRIASDLGVARRRVRARAIELGFQGGDVTLIEAVISEVGKNMIDYAGGGTIFVTRLQEGAQEGISIVARDSGPGIPDVSKVLQYGCATRKGLGMGLPAVRWLVDEFVIDSVTGKGTTISMKKWIKKTQ